MSVDAFTAEFDRQLADLDREPPAWHSDPVVFAEQCIEWGDEGGLTGYQAEVMAALVPECRVTVRAPHGVGKSALAAIVMLWFALSRDAAGTDFKCLATAGAWRQLERYLMPELAKWAKRIRWDVVGRAPFGPNELTALTLKLRHGQVFAGASDDAALLEGLHATAVLIVLDEAKSIIPDTWEAVEGAMNGPGEAFALATSTPGAPTGRFYEIHQRRPGFEDWRCFHVKLEDALAAGQIDPAWVEQRALQWGRDSAVFQNRVLGNFCDDDQGGVIPLSWVEDAVERWHEHRSGTVETLPTPSVIGVDVGSTGDKSVIVRRRGDFVEIVEKLNTVDTMAVTGHVIAAMEVGGRAVVDAIGIGGPVVWRLREQGWSAEGFMGSHGSTRKDRSGSFGFLNRRAASWWNLRELLQPFAEDDSTSLRPTLALPPDDELIGDLTAPKWTLNSSGKVVIEAKDQVKKRLGRSPDCGDAVVMACEGLSHGWRGMREAGGSPETVFRHENAVDWSYLGVTAGPRGIDWNTHGRRFPDATYFTHGGSQ